MGNRDGNGRSLRKEAKPAEFLLSIILLSCRHIALNSGKDEGVSRKEIFFDLFYLTCAGYQPFSTFLRIRKSPPLCLFLVSIHSKKKRKHATLNNYRLIFFMTRKIICRITITASLTNIKGDRFCLKLSNMGYFL